MGKRKITEEQIVDICKKYQEGFSTLKLGIEYCISSTHIGILLKNNNIQMRNGSQHLVHKDYIINLFNNGTLISEISRKLKIDRKSIEKILLDNNIKEVYNRELETESIIKFKEYCKEMLHLIKLNYTNA